MNCVALAKSSPRGLFLDFLKVTYRLNILGRLLNPFLDHGISFKKHCLSIEGIHLWGPLYERYAEHVLLWLVLL